MLAKIGLILIVLAMGAGLFLSGTLAPESLRATVARHTPALLAPPAAAKKDAAGAAGAEGGDPAAAKGGAEGDTKGDTKTSAGGADAKKDAKKKPLPYESLLIPVTPPDKSRYTLQVGLYRAPEDARQLTAELTLSGYAFQWIEVQDPQGESWQLLAAGDYDDLDGAETARDALARALNLLAAPAPILLPPPPPPKK